MMPARVAVAPDKYAKGFDGTGREVPDAYEVMEVAEALERTYSTDAHLVTYVVADADRQPRINKTGLQHFDRPVEISVFFCDIDNPEHRAWDDELLAGAIAQYDELEILRSAGVYHTQHGRRIVQPIMEPISVVRVEPYIRRWLMDLEMSGLAVDWACRDWTRHFRLPHVRRGGRAYRSPFLSLERMKAIGIAPIDIADTPPPPTRGNDTTAPPPVAVNWSLEVPPVWRPRVAILAEAIRAVSTEWHTLFLAVAGALLSRGVPPEQVPTLCRAISLETGRDARTHDREAAARTTVQRHLGGHPTTGYRSLAETWPVVADAFDRALAQGGEAHLRALCARPPPVPPRSLDETKAALEDAIRRAPDGLTLISAECGLGKTAAAIRIACERAAKPYLSPDAEGLRAPVQSKTSISVDKNALAIQVVSDIHAGGVAARRIFGPLSLLREDGKPECRFHEIARPLVEGGQAMQWELCHGRDLEPCEFFHECRAKDGSDGPPNSRVTVGTHALLAELDGAAGSTGLLIIDEPPPLLETSVFTVDELDIAHQMLYRFDGRYAGAMAPALEAVRAWVVELGEPDRAMALADAIRTAAHVVDPADLAQAQRSSGTAGDAVECARAAHFPERHGTAPPLQFVYLSMARKSVSRATELGTASKVLRAIYHALTSESPVAARIERHGENRWLVLTGAREKLSQALRRDGAVVVTDASAELHQPVFAKVVGYDPPHHRFSAVDGAPIERTLIRCRAATRRRWLPGRQLDLDASLVSAVRAVFDWAREDRGATRLALITMYTIELALAAALRPADTSIETAWKEDGQKPAILVKVRETLGPMVGAWKGQVVLGHYGAVRGMNTMFDVDCLATLGDPWPNLGSVKSDIAFLGLEEAWEARTEAMCRAELEQAHGRLRAVHRQRPGRALHVGSVLPSGAGWSSGQVRVRRLNVGRPKGIAAMTPAELAPIVLGLGGLRATARALGCDHSTLHRYLDGERPIPAAIADRVRDLDIAGSGELRQLRAVEGGAETPDDRERIL